MLIVLDIAGTSHISPTKIAELAERGTVVVGTHRESCPDYLSYSETQCLFVNLFKACPQIKGACYTIGVNNVPTGYKNQCLILPNIKPYEAAQLHQRVEYMSLISEFHREGTGVVQALSQYYCIPLDKVVLIGRDTRSALVGARLGLRYIDLEAVGNGSINL